MTTVEKKPEPLTYNKANKGFCGMRRFVAA
jgi:hypothetical protein